MTAEPLADGLLEPEGEQLRAIELGHTDTDGTSALHVPSTGLVVAGDAVYGDVNLYLSEAKGDGRGEWVDALDIIERLQPGVVVAGHKRDGDADSPENIGKTRHYIEDFSAAVEKAHNSTDLYEQWSPPQRNIARLRASIPVCPPVAMTAPIQMKPS